LGELPKHVGPLVEFLLFTGWRVSEAKSLRWAQVDFAGGGVRLEAGSTKTGAARVFPFAALPALAAFIRTQCERTSATSSASRTLLTECGSWRHTRLRSRMSRGASYLSHRMRENKHTSSTPTGFSILLSVRALA